MIHLAPISTRNQFGRLLTSMGLTAWAVEVGTHRGEFAEVLLSQWPGVLYCVDPWENLPGYGSQAKDLRAIGGDGVDRDADLAACRERLARFGGRAMMRKATSVEMASRILDGMLDFAFIDGDHSRPMVEQDLRIWWPRLRAGGVLAAHDWLCPGEYGGGHGAAVQPAVLEFAELQGVDVQVVAEENGLPWTAFLIKPQR